MNSQLPFEKAMFTIKINRGLDDVISISCTFLTTDLRNVGKAQPLLFQNALSHYIVFNVYVEVNETIV